MATEALLTVDPTSIPLPSSPIPRIHTEPPKTESLVSIRLTEPVSPAPHDEKETTPRDSNATISSTSHIRRRSSIDIMHGVDLDTELKSQEAETEQHDDDNVDETVAVIPDDDVTLGRCSFEEHEIKIDGAEDDTCSVSSTSSDHSINSRHSSDSDVDWSELDKEEKSEPRDEGSDEVRQ